jgi:hypothetical protein
MTLLGKIKHDLQQRALQIKERNVNEKKIR